MAAEITLVLGGARSGKSEVAERLALDLAPGVSYLATGPVHEDDPDWSERVARHRARRPAAWSTMEVGGDDLASRLCEIDGPALVDSLGTWVAGFEDASPGREATARLCAALTDRRSAGLATVVVSEEVGLGVHPSSDLGRRFRDALGLLNQDVAEVADRVLLVVAGRVLPLDRAGGAGS